MKKIVFTALGAAVLLSASYYGYRQVSNSSESDLFMANVEALSSMEYDEDACSMMYGFEDVGITYGVKTERTHVCDTIDCEIDYSYTYCFAEGRGKRQGYNGYVDVSPSEPKNVKCTNDHVLVFF